MEEGSLVFDSLAAGSPDNFLDGSADPLVDILDREDSSN